MKNSKKGFILGVLLALLSCFSSFGYYTSTPDYHVWSAVPYQLFIEIIGGFVWFFYGFPLGLPILFVLFCGFIGYLFGKAFDKGEETLEINGTIIEKRTLRDFIKSYKWILIIILIILCVYPLNLYLKGMENPGLLCQGSYNPDTYEGCTKNYAEVNTVLKVNILYVLIYFVLIFSILKFLDIGKRTSLAISNPIYRNTVIKWLAIPIIILSIVSFGYNKQRYPYYDDYSVEKCESVDNSVDEPSDNSRARCFHEVAVEKQDASICNNLTSTNQTYTQGFCVEEVAHAKNDIALCDLIKDDNNRRYGCYRWFNQCQKIDNVEYRDGCYRNRAEFSTDGVKTCSLMTQTKEKDYCFRDLAGYRKDITICSNVKDPYIQRECTDGVNIQN